jgi:hypothetical protein
MAIQKAHGHDHYSSIHLFVVWKTMWASSWRLEWVEDLDMAKNTLEILVTKNRGNKLKLLFLGHM